jgi:hypothetical protein
MLATMPRKLHPLVLSAVALVAGCSVAATAMPSGAAEASTSQPARSASWHWSDPDVHIVDGYYVSTEWPCPDRGTDICPAATRVGAAGIERLDPGARVTAATLAAIPSAWTDIAGTPHHLTFAGLGQPMFVVLTLDSGTRRTVPLYCTGAMYAGGESSPFAAAHCQVSGGALWRVGAPAPPDTGF